jgi:hypothetical protein
MKRFRVQPGCRLLDLKAAALYLGRSINAVKKLYYAGKLNYIQHCPRGKIYFDRIELDEFIEQGRKHASCKQWEY